MSRSSIRRWAPVRLVIAYVKSQASNYASGLAFNMLMTAFPLMVGLGGIVGLVLRDPERERSVESSLVGFFPGDAGGAIHHALGAVQQHSGLLGLIGLVGFLWSGSSLFVAMEWPFDQIYGVPARSFVAQRLMALAMTVAFAIALLGSVVVSSVLGGAAGVPLLTPLVGFAIWTVFLLLLYGVVPNRRLGWHHVWPGAVIAGALMEILSLLWPLYVHLSHGFDSYGAAFALFFLLATWLYLVSQVMLLGIIANNLGAGPGLPSKDAQPAPAQ